MTIIALETTFIKAIAIDATINSKVTIRGSSGKVKKRIIREVNSTTPIMISQLFLLVPHIGTLSLISPYKIFKLQGREIKDI
jgi:hypothetical protein